MRVRKVVTRRGRRIRGFFPSTKLGRMVAWESLLEKDALLLLELSPGVIHYQEQPAVISYWDGTQHREYVPDLAATLLNQQTIHIEVKPSTELIKPSIRAKYQAIAEHYQRTGQVFRILTELEIRREPRFGNLKMLAEFVRLHMDQLPCRQEIKRQLHGSSSSTLTEFDNLFGRPVTAHLIAAGLLTCNLDQPLLPSTELTLVKGDRNATILF